jgi:heterodisulfide reductase subunit A-like polyferredoxin
MWNFYQGCLYCSDVTTSEQTNTCNFGYAHKKNVALPVPICTKIVNAQYHNVQVSYTDFYPHPAVNVEKYGQKFMKSLK